MARQFEISRCCGGQQSALCQDKGARGQSPARDGDQYACLRHAAHIVGAIHTPVVPPMPKRGVRQKVEKDLHEQQKVHIARVFGVRLSFQGKEDWCGTMCLAGSK